MDGRQRAGVKFVVEAMEGTLAPVSNIENAQNNRDPDGLAVSEGKA
jgi:hypothetical protein